MNFLKNLRINRLVAIFSMVIVIFLVGSVWMATQVNAVGNAILWINPADSQAITDTEVELQLDNVNDVYGMQVDLEFDPSILEVADADSGKPGVQIATGECPAPDFVVSNVANNTTGQIEYAVTQMNPTQPCNGGVVATIHFTCLGEGSSNVEINTSVISNANGEQVGHVSQNAAIECVPHVFTIQGAVALQNWSDPSGTTVQLIDMQTDNIIENVQVGSDGSFSFAASIDNSYYVIASYEHYLSAKEENITGITGEVVDLGLSTLRAGDLNGDSVINILDIVTVAGNYNVISPTDW